LKEFNSGVKKFLCIATLSLTQALNISCKLITKTMKTIFYRLILATMLSVMALQTFAQDVLRYGVTPNHPVVQLPLFYWDLLHNSGVDWTEQHGTASGTTTVWHNYQKYINQKNGNGLFTEITTLDWNTASKTWENSYQNLFTYSQTSSNEPTEVIWEKIAPGYTGGAKFNNTYTQGKLTEMVISFKNGGGFIPITQSFILYNNEGNRNIDSGVSVQTGNPNYQNEYLYDNQHHCTKESYFEPNQGSVMTLKNVSEYTYNTDGQLETAGIFAKNNNQLEKLAYYEFRYTDDGKIEGAAIYATNPITKVFEPAEQYWHYYDAQNRLVAMVKRNYNATQEWDNTDSVAINYLPGGEYDTAYVFAPDGTNTWETSPTQRLLFDAPTNTGIQSPTVANIGIKAYPIPAHNTVYVEFEAKDITEIVITNITGQNIIAQTVEANAGQTTKAAINLAGLAPGVYLLHAGQQTQKIIIE
jgi:hypothetical protein